MSNTQVRLGWFCTIAIMCMLFLIGSMFFPQLETFWAGNRLWSAGSFLVCISVLQSRFFDVRRSASPFNQRIDESMWLRLFRFLEWAFSHVWLVGFVLVGASRWIHY
jgi:hypothetical protein